MASKAQPIPRKEWEHHKQTILRLYNEKPLQDVRAEMEKDYAFKASASQLDHQIRNVWGFRKNTKRSEWEDRFKQADALESTQKTPAGRVKPLNSFKRARRYLKASQNRSPNQPQASSGALRNAPSSILQDVAPTRETATPVQINSEGSQDINLSFDFENALANLETRLFSNSQVSVTNQIGLTSTGYAFLPAVRSPLDCNFPFDFAFRSENLGHRSLSFDQTAIFDQGPAASLSSSNPINYTWRADNSTSRYYNSTFDDDIQLGLTGPQITIPSEQNHFIRDIWSQGHQSPLHLGIQTLSGVELPAPNTLSYSSHFIRFEEFLIAKGVSFTPPALPGSGSLSLISNGFTAKFIAEMVLSKQQSLTRSAVDLEQALDRLETLIPGENTALITKDQAFAFKFTRILFFSMLNGFAGLNQIPVQKILRFLGRHNIMSRSFLMALKDNTSPAAKTFLDVIFQASIEAKNEHTLKQILEHRLVDVNAPLYFSERGRQTPIARAAWLQAYSLIEVLLHYGADPNKAGEGRWVGSPLTDLLGRLSARSFNDHNRLISETSNITKTVELLVEAKVKVTFDDLHCARGLFATYDIASRLSLAIPSSQHKEFFKSSQRRDGSSISHIAITATYPDDTQGSQIIRNMIDLCKKDSCGECLSLNPTSLEHAVIQAANQGHLEVVRLLINHVRLSTTIFCAAIRSRNKHLIDFVLSLKPDLNPQAEETKDSELILPLAEAVKAGNEELIQYLHSGGAFTCLNDRKRLEPLICAAADCGNVSLMRQLLFYCDNSSNPDGPPSRAIRIALDNGHEDVAWLLVESGTSVNCRPMRGYKPRSALQAALKSQNKSLVQAILNADFQEIVSEDYDEALKWDDTSIIIDLLSAYPTPRLTSKTLQNLCRRCMHDDNTNFFRNFVEWIFPFHLGHEGSDLTSCLEEAVRMGRSDMICYLLDIGVNPFTNSVLKEALTGHKGILHLLFSKSRSRQYVPKCVGASVMSTVMDESLNAPQALDALLETRAVNLIAMEDYFHIMGPITPLGLALMSISKTPEKDPWAVRALLKGGSDPNGLARKLPYPHTCYTGFMLALETARHDIVQLLIDSGANINLKPRFAVKRTPLQYAAEVGHLDMVRMLISRGAEVNAEAAIRSGGTALQFAALSGNCNIANELLTHGAHLDALPSKVQGRWPLEGAAEHGRLDMIEFLWTEAINRGGSDVVTGFQERHCLRAMKFAHENGHLACMDLISSLSGIPVGRVETNNYGAPWLAFSDLSHSSSYNDWGMPFLTGSGMWVNNDNLYERADFQTRGELFHLGLDNWAEPSNSSNSSE